MTSPTVVPTDLQVLGKAYLTGGVDLPADSVGDTQVSGGLGALKLEHQHQPFHVQDDGSDVVTETKVLAFMMAAGTMVSMEVRPETAPTGGDKQYTVDLQKAANGSTSYATVLSAVVTVDSSSVDGTLQAGTISTTALAKGDSLRVVITASGSTGSQGQGVTVMVKYRESA